MKTLTTADVPFRIIDTPSGMFTIFSHLADARGVSDALNAETARQQGRAEYDVFQRADGKFLVACSDPEDEVSFYIPAAWVQAIAA